MKGNVYGYVRVSTKDRMKAARKLSVAQDTFLRWVRGK